MCWYIHVYICVLVYRRYYYAANSAHVLMCHHTPPPLPPSPSSPLPPSLPPAQEDLVSQFKQAVSQVHVPEITHTILNLAEFMEHCEEATVSG